jgi:hypothetical protein
MSENGKAKPIETTPMVLDTPQTVDIRDASAHGLALMEERVRNQKKMIAIAISLTSPSQWVVFSGGEGKETVYPTGGAADTILRRAFGLGFTRQISVEDTGDGRLATCVLGLKRNNGEVFEEFTGYRYMGGFVKNEASLRSGAEENAKSKAVRDLLGLRFRTPAELKEMGLDIGKMERRAEFQDHSDHAAAPGTVVAPFGKGIKGKPITDITDKDLAWLTNAIKESVTDPEKAKWKAKNEQLLAALLEERKRRDAPQQEKPNGGEAPAPTDDGVDVNPQTGEVRLCAYPECDAPATRGVYCGEHPPKQKPDTTSDVDESEAGSRG